VPLLLNARGEKTVAALVFLSSDGMVLPILRSRMAGIIPLESGFDIRVRKLDDDGSSM
jgi:hypothetical protein